MKDFEEVIRELKNSWQYDSIIPFEKYYDMVYLELARMKFTPTPEQLEALLTLDKITLIDSTAGSGKTTTIVIKSIIDEILWGMDPYKIMFLTFSKKSANDMLLKRDRYISKFYNRKNGARMSTLHALCYKFLIAFHSDPGGMYNFNLSQLVVDEMAYYGDLDSDEDMEENLLDFDEQRFSRKTGLDIIKRFIVDDVELKYIDNMEEMRNILACFDFQKERMLSNEDILKERVFSSLRCIPEHYFRLKDQVEKHKKQYELFNFTDLQEEVLKLLTEHKDYFFNDKSFQTVFKPSKLYVDEVQDMTPLQKQLIKALVEIPVEEEIQTSLVCIGDGDQTIYTWRGSEPLQFDTFCDVFDPNREKAKLEIFSRNHRCGEVILTASAKLIKNNILRNDKQMSCGVEHAGNFEIIYYTSPKEQINSIMVDIRALKHDKAELEKTAIIYREHSQAMGLVTALLREDIPFDLAGMKLPYKHWIFKALLQFCEALLFDYKDYTVDILYKFTSMNKKDVGALKKQLISQTEGKGWVQILEENAEKRKHPFISDTLLTDLKTLQFMIREPEDKKVSIKQIIQILYKMYQTYSLKFVLDNYIFCDRSEIEAVEYFIDSIPTNETYLEFLEEIQLWDKYILNYKSQQSGIKLMTLHATKGLEFDRVFILGVDSSYLPKELYAAQLDTKNKLEYIEEERRLLFVGITRAKKICKVFASIISPSIYILELDPEVANIRKENSSNRIKQVNSFKSSRVNESIISTLSAEIIQEKLFKEELLCISKLILN